MEERKSSFFVNFFRLLSGSATYGREVLYQRRFIKNQLGKLFSEAQTADRTIKASDVKRMQNYALLTATVLGENYATLRGQPLSESERITQTYLGALTPLFDDYFDQESQKENPVKAMMDDPFGFPAKKEREKLFCKLLQQIHRTMPGREAIFQTAHEVFRTQKESLKQLEKTTDRAAIWQVSLDKGGQAALLFRQVMDNPLKPEEEHAIWQWGAVIQLLDDTFDIYEDFKAGIRTVATTSQDMEVYAKEVTQHIDELVRLFRALPYPDARVQKALNKMMFIVCWAWVALEQFQKLQRKNGPPFKLNQFQRKELICDMAKLSNQLKGGISYCRYGF